MTDNYQVHLFIRGHTKLQVNPALSQVMNWPYKSTPGFTLIEVLVVIIIVSVLAGVTVLSFDINSPARTLEREAQRLRFILVTAAEQALLQGAEYGLRLSKEEYRVLKFDVQEKQWRQSGLPIFQLHRLPASVDLVLEVENRLFIPAEAAGTDMRSEKKQDNETPGTMPHILMFSSGELTPFDIYLSIEEGVWTYRISGTEMQAIRLEKAEHVGHPAY